MQRLIFKLYEHCEGLTIHQQLLTHGAALGEIGEEVIEAAEIAGKRHSNPAQFEWYKGIASSEIFSATKQMKKKEPSKYRFFRGGRTLFMSSFPAHQMDPRGMWTVWLSTDELLKVAPGLVPAIGKSLYNLIHPDQPNGSCKEKSKSIQVLGASILFVEPLVVWTQWFRNARADFVVLIPIHPTNSGYSSDNLPLSEVTVVSGSVGTEAAMASEGSNKNQRKFLTTDASMHLQYNKYSLRPGQFAICSKTRLFQINIGDVGMPLPFLHLALVYDADGTVPVFSSTNYTRLTEVHERSSLTSSCISFIASRGVNGSDDVSEEEKIGLLQSKGEILESSTKVKKFTNFWTSTNAVGAQTLKAV